MAETRRLWTDRQVEQIVGDLLRVGVIVAAAVVLTGGILYLAHHGALIPDYRVFQGQPTDLRSASGIVKFAVSLHSRGLIMLGMLLLVATPIARVAFSIIAFALEGDRAYVIVTVIVFTALIYSIAGGIL